MTLTNHNRKNSNLYPKGNKLLKISHFDWLAVPHPARTLALALSSYAVRTCCRAWHLCPSSTAIQTLCFNRDVGSSDHFLLLTGNLGYSEQDEELCLPLAWVYLDYKGSRLPIRIGELVLHLLTWGMILCLSILVTVHEKCLVITIYLGIF